MKNYAETYQKMMAPLQDKPRLLAAIIWINTHITQTMYVFYPLLLIYLGYQTSVAGQNVLKNLLPFILVPGVSFLIMSMARKYYNQPRPYETWDIEPLIPKESSGESMPSRHVFSATIISMCALRVHVYLGILLLIYSLMLAICRVLGGVHYPKDVLVGFLVGIVTGGLLFLS